MPRQIESMPGSWSRSLPWEEMADGLPWVITEQEMVDAGTKLETVRVYAHEYAKANGGKFRTKSENGDLYLQFTAS